MKYKDIGGKLGKFSRLSLLKDVRGQNITLSTDTQPLSTQDSCLGVMSKITLILRKPISMYAQFYPLLCLL